MTKKLRRTWRSLELRAKLLVALVALLCGAAFAGSLAMEDAFIPWGDSEHIGTNDDIIDSNFPSWFGAAFKTGSGVWDTNIPAWTVPSDDTNDAALEVFFNRSLLTNSLIVNLGYRDSTNASLSLDVLHLTNQSVLPSTLIENLLIGSGNDTSRTFNVPLDLNAVGLQFRRGSGAITIRDTLLSPDSDGDGYSDSEEFAWGSDPSSALSVPCAAITGQIFYAGVQSGVLHVLAATNTSDWASAYYITMSLPISTHVAPFTLSGLPLRHTYYARAWRDVNDNQTKDYWEPSGTAIPANLYLGGNTGSVVIVMADPDSDGDGMSDVTELALGLNPFSFDIFTRLPFIERFETNTVVLGDINGQNGWRATSSQTVLVQTGAVWEGQQAVSFKMTNDIPVNVSQLFAVSNAPIVWVDMHVRAFEATAPTNFSKVSVMMLFDGNGYLKVYNGLSTLSNKWISLSNMAPCAATGEWVRLSVKSDYPAQQWLVCFNGQLLAKELGFASPVAEFSMLSLDGISGGLDALRVSTNEPAGLSLDLDTIPDDWERIYFGNLNQEEAGDFDADGVSNLAEYRLGLDPTNSDSDHDGMPDGWEIANFFSPTNSGDAAMDADADGLSNLVEHQLHTDPQGTDTDHDGLADGMEVNTWHTDPVSADSDGDGYNDGDEVARGTDPLDAASHPASHWRNHLKLTFREGSLTNRLADVPILIRLTPERIDYSQCATNGRDIYFTDSAGLPLDFEMEKWTPGGESLLWVRLPEAGGTNSADHFWLHTNYPEATNAANFAAVWSSNYLGVWHFAATNTLLADSSPGAYAATNAGAVCVTGILGNARNFRGSDSVIVPPVALAAISNAVTISFWQFGATNQPLNNACFEGTSAAGREFNALVSWSDGNVYWDAFGNYDRINKLATTNLYKGGWNHWTFTKDRAAGTMCIYVNGELWHSGTGKTRAYSPVTAFRFGSGANGSYGYVGRLDELRIESVAQSPEWIRFQHKSMLDQALLYGEQQVSIAGTGNAAEPAQAGEFTLIRSVTDQTNLSLTVNLATPNGNAIEGVDFVALPRSVVIPSGATQVTFPVPVIDDLWLEGNETVSVAIAQGNYFISAANASASIAIIDDDVDADGDGMCDAWEILKFGNLDTTATGDADNDGANNLQEYLHITNPNDADTDHDGLPDQWEISNGTDPLTPDADADPDNDGLTNMQEYQLGTNPRAADTDGDGMPDKWEVDHALNPLVNDASLDPDQDGLTNLKEYQNGTDLHNPDTDGDGLTDGAEINTYKTSPLKSDTDADGLPDKWEVDNGTNPRVNDASGDPDGDQLLNIDEYRAGTNPKAADTDGDGVNDKVEVMAYADPLVRDFDGTVADILMLNGSDATSWVGTWTQEGSAIYARERSGSLNYALSVPSNGTFAVAVNVTQQNALTAQNTFDLSLFIDGTFSGRQIVKAPCGANCTGVFFLPQLTAGSHVLRLRWNNDAPNTFIQVNSVKLQAFGGLDANTNGIPDWLDHRMASLSEAGAIPESSVVSPVCLEGTAVYQDQLSVAASFMPNGQTQQIVAVQHGVGTAWYANIFISPTNTTDIVITDHSSGVVVTNSVVWDAVNLLVNSYSNGLAIRGGSSLLLAAWPTESTNGVSTLTIWNGTNVVTNMVTAAGSSVPYCFGQAGTFTVSGSYSNETTSTNGTLSVRVVTGAFNGREADCVTGQARTWDCPGITTAAVVTADSQLSVSSTNLSGGGTRFTLMNPTDRPLYMVARLGAGGIILDSAKISSIYADHGTYFKVVETFADGSRMTEVRLQLGYVPENLTVKLHVFVGGVTFLDGTLDRTLTAADFNEIGVCTYRMIQSAASQSSTCHTTKLYQGGLYIGGN